MKAAKLGCEFVKKGLLNGDTLQRRVLRTMHG